MPKTPEAIIRDEIRALTAYPVPDAGGMVKLDAMENPYALPQALRREIADLVAGAALNQPVPTVAELVAADFKEFLIGGKKLGVSQMMALDSAEIAAREPELLEELERLRLENKYDLAALLVLNPLGESQERILVRGEAWIVEKAFNVTVRQGACTIPRVLSRKKDFIPAIGQVLSLGRNR